MATAEERLKRLETQMRRAIAVANALQGLPSDATLALPHNDSLWYADNIDGTHAANLYYIVPGNIQRIVSARLSMKLLPYRTYNTLSVTVTGTESQGHNHGHAHSEGSHHHDMFDIGGVPPAATNTTWFAGTGGTNPIVLLTPNAGTTSPLQTYNAAGAGTSTDTTGESATHTHALSASGVLGVTEGATATGIAIAFDGVDATAALGGPFNADVVELDVRKYLVVTQGAWHLIAMQPTGVGRINAHLRLGYYASSGQVE